MKMRRFVFKQLAILGLVLFISIGFAYLSTQLTITGRGHVKKSSFNIYFDNITILKGQDLVTTAPTTSGHSTTDLSYAVDFKVPGDTFQFNVDVVNNGTIDAMISLLNNTTLDEDEASFAEYSIAYSDGSAVASKNFLGASKRDTFTVTVSFKRDITVEDLAKVKPVDFELSL